MSNGFSFQVVNFQRFSHSLAKKGFSVDNTALFFFVFLSFPLFSLFSSFFFIFPKNQTCNFLNPKITVFESHPFFFFFFLETQIVEASDFDPSIAESKFRSAVGSSFGSG
ncbi:hypothetical protein VNO78_33035 [Psophocarpus tetragonolobus]|uniref:Uncharacterized protein n=1 Tax=Psophocarpus tetragonolobus TaxID=3891 RepID=A0AAN9RQF4_PSOTE